MLPLGPIKQYTAEPVDGPLILTAYPGADGSCFRYEDDGDTFDFRRGASMRLEMQWDDAGRKLALRLAPGSKMLRASIPLEVKLAGSYRVSKAVFTGEPVLVSV